MRHSDIFDDFAKIAMEKGLISKGSPEELKRKLEENPRMDSLDISAIEALYGVKPDTPKDMQYKKNIIEDAHPNSVVVSPSYDKLNGLVENLNERQNIIMNIVQRTPDGHIINRKYAEQQLLLTLVRIGNDLDNRNQTELRTLADVCLEQTAIAAKKKVNLTKNGTVVAAVPLAAAGLAPLTIASLIAVPTILGAIYLQQHIGLLNEGFEKNHEKLISEIDDLLNASVSWGVGRQYTQEFITAMQEFKKEIEKRYGDYQRILPIIKSLEKARTGKELLDLAKSPESKTVINAYKFFREEMDDFLPYLNKIEQNFKSETYKIRQIEDKGWLEKAVDWTQILHGGWGFIADDFDDVNRSIAPYKKSIGDILKVLQEAESVEKNAKQQVDTAATTSTSDFGVPFTGTTPTGTSSAKSPVKPSIKPSRITIDEQAKALEQDFESLRL
jgi:hypothetical protein